MNPQHAPEIEVIYEQLYLYERNTEEKIRDEIKELKESISRIRKGQYAKIGALHKMYQETKHELETLKAAICRNQIIL